MKKLILAVVALLLVGGVGFGAYMYFGKSAEAAAVEGDKKGDAQKQEEAKNKAAAEAAAVAFVKMDPLVLPILGKNGVSQVVNLAVTLEVKDAETAKEVEKEMPRLRDAYIQDMYGALTMQSAMADGVVQVGYIKERLSRITTKVLGEEKVKNVLLQALQQRRAS